MNTYSMALAFITVTACILCAALMVDAYQRHRKHQAHLDAYAKLREHWEKKRLKEYEEAQADQIQSQ